jgi:Transposase protein
MPTQLHLAVQPAGAREINGVVAMVEREDHVAYFASGVPLFVHRANDPVGRRVAAVQMMELGLARQDELSVALRINRTTLYRQQRQVPAHGVLGVVDGQRGPRGPHRFTSEKRERVAELLAAGRSIRHAAAQVGVTEGTVRHALRRGELQPAPRPSSPALGPRTRSEQAARAAGGVAVRRHPERALARLGQLTEAAPRFVAAEAVRAGGVLLALPAVLTLGLLDAGQQVYGALRNGFYGLQATLLCLTFMALLRIRTPEQLQGQPPGELGILLVLDRAPEVKTLRRKLGELAARRQATQFSQRLAERWVRDQADAVGLLYIDGHVRPYHGTAHTVPEAYVTRRRLCMPATTDVWVQQQDAQPLFVVTAPANDDLLAMLRTQILPEIRRLVGERRVTLCFDREGWSPQFFHECHAQGFDILTYRRGPYPVWRRAAFRSTVVEGRTISYMLAERVVGVLPGFRMREVRRLCDGGHQTAILTTRRDLPMAVVAYRMFERWTQENFFRYMRQHFALDALVTYAVEPADPDRTVPNPARKVLRKQLTEARAALNALEQAYGHAAQNNPEGRRPTMRGFKIAHGALGHQIRAQEQACRLLKARIAALPKRVPVKTVVEEGEIVKLAPEAKHLTDTIKMVAYRAETALVRCVAPHYARTEDEGRALIRELLASSADLVPDPVAKHLRVHVHALANPRSNAALAQLCDTLNALEMQYPGTDLTLVYEAPGVA